MQKRSMLDKPESYTRGDVENLRAVIEGFPAQARDAARRVAQVALEPLESIPRSLYICGMGGSGIGGEVVKGVLSPSFPTPVTVVHDYTLPAACGKESLVVVVSYSGDTEETLACAEEAIRRGAKVMALASGGKLKTLADTHKFLFVPLEVATQSPRMTLAAQVASIATVLARLKIISDSTLPLERALEEVSVYGQGLLPSVPTERNVAKHLAYSLYDRLPVVIASSAFEAAARRWKSQFNENAKLYAFAEILPELDHNMVEGTKFPRHIRDEVAGVFLASSFDHPENRRRFAILKEFFEKEGLISHTVSAQGSSFLSHMLSLILLGDWTSYYLAILEGANPTEITSIPWAKERLRNKV